MEKRPTLNISPTTPLTKTNLQVRIVSNKEKENISPDVFLSPSENSAFTRSESQDASIFIEIPSIPQEILNPFLSEIKKVSNFSDASTCNNSENNDEKFSNLKKTDSLMRINSSNSELSLLSLQNQAKGYNCLLYTSPSPRDRG